MTTETAAAPEPFAVDGLLMSQLAPSDVADDDIPLEACVPEACVPEACVPAARRTPPPLARPGAASRAPGAYTPGGYTPGGGERPQLRRAAGEAAGATKARPRTEAVVGVLQLERHRPSSCFDAYDAEVAGLLACWAGGLLRAARAYESS